MLRATVRDCEGEEKTFPASKMKAIDSQLLNLIVRFPTTLDFVVIAVVFAQSKLFYLFMRIWFIGMEVA